MLQSETISTLDTGRQTTGRNNQESSQIDSDLKQYEAPDEQLIP